MKMTDDSTPAVSVIAVVLNWRDPLATQRCVISLAADPAITSVIVVDNESQGELRHLNHGRTAVIEQSNNLGFSRGVNCGIRRALEDGADAVLIINNDAYLNTDSVQPLLDAIHTREPRIGLIAPLIIYPDGTRQSTGSRFSPWTASTNDLFEGKPNYLTWACVLVPRSTFELVGVLDERFFMYWEDVDFGLRVRDAGLELMVLSDVKVVHSRSQSHQRAGRPRIDRYSTHGLVLLCLKRGGVAKVIGLPLRMLIRFVTRIPRLSRLMGLFRGAADGLRAYRETDASRLTQQAIIED